MMTQSPTAVGDKLEHGEHKLIGVEGVIVDSIFWECENCGMKAVSTSFIELDCEGYSDGT